MVVAHKRGYRRAGDVLHDKVRKSVIRGSGVNQSSNVRVLQSGQDLPFSLKPPQYFVGIGPAFEEFDCNLFFELAIGAFGQVDTAHSTAANFTDDPVSAHPLA